MIIQAIGVSFSLFALIITYTRYKEAKISPTMVFVWTFIWVNLALFVLFPEKYEALSQIIGIKRPLDFMLVMGLTTVFYLNFRLYIQLEDIRRDQSEIVREIGINKEKPVNVDEE